VATVAEEEAPVMWRESSEARKITGGTMSAGFEIRLNGVRSRTASLRPVFQSSRSRSA
jgi:hypothetical protein